jgi:hypothetical protein
VLFRITGCGFTARCTNYLINKLVPGYISNPLIREISEAVAWGITGYGETGKLRAGAVVRAVREGRSEVMDKGKDMGTGAAVVVIAGTAGTVTGATGSGTGAAGTAGNRVVTLNPAGVTAGTTGMGITGAGVMTGDGTSGTTGVSGTRIAVGAAVGTAVMEPPAVPPGIDALDRPASGATTAACFGAGAGRNLVTSASNPSSRIPGSTKD